MKNLSDNVMSSLGLQAKAKGPRVDPLEAVNRTRESKKDIKAKAYKAALLDLLYLQVTTGQVPGLRGQLGQQGVTGGYPQMLPPGGLPMPQMGAQLAAQMGGQMGGVPPEMMAGMAGGGMPQGAMG